MARKRRSTGRRTAAAKARRKWKSMSPSARARAMPSWTPARKRRARRQRPGGLTGREGVRPKRRRRR